jgi:hypothetical protein
MNEENNLDFNEILAEFKTATKWLWVERVMGSGLYF